MANKKKKSNIAVAKDAPEMDWDSIEEISYETKPSGTAAASNPILNDTLDPMVGDKNILPKMPSGMINKNRNKPAADEAINIDAFHPEFNRQQDKNFRASSQKGEYPRINNPFSVPNNNPFMGQNNIEYQNEEKTNSRSQFFNPYGGIPQNYQSGYQPMQNRYYPSMSQQRPNQQFQSRNWRSGSQSEREMGTVLENGQPIEVALGPIFKNQKTSENKPRSAADSDNMADKDILPAAYIEQLQKDYDDILQKNDNFQNLDKEEQKENLAETEDINKNKKDNDKNTGNEIEKKAAEEQENKKRKINKSTVICITITAIICVAGMISFCIKYMT